MKPLLFVFFNYRILILSVIYKINACKKLQNYPLAQTNVRVISFFFDLRKLVLVKIYPLELI